MAPPPQMQCSSTSCDFVTPENIPTYELLIRSLEIHVQTVHQASQNLTHGPKTEKPKRPSVTTGLSESEWTFFVNKWERYVRQAKLEGQHMVDELWTCMDSELEKLAFGDNVATNDPTVLLQKIKSLAVTTLHPSIHVVNLHQMKQNQDESSKAFSTRVRSTAANCNLQKPCTKDGCSEVVSYIEETCYHVVMSGLADQDMKDRALTQAMLGVIKDLPSLLNFTTAEESAKVTVKTEVGAVNQNRKTLQGRKCGYCGGRQHGEYNKLRSAQCKAYGGKCNKCQKPNHFASVCNSSKSPIAKKHSNNAAIQEDVLTSSEVGGFIASVICTSKVSSPSDAAPLVQQLRQKSDTNVNSIPVPHYSYDVQRSQWKRQPPKPSPSINVSLKLDRRAYKELRLNQPQMVKKNGAGFARARRAVSDTGAQLTVVNVRELAALGIKKHTIFQLATTVNTVTRASIDLVGGVFLEISACDPTSRVVRRTRQLCYVSNTVPGIYLSREACVDLGCVPESFPSIGQCNGIKTEIAKDPCDNSGVQVNVKECDCPKRELPPMEPPTLPCAPTEKNVEILKQYILERYATSAFNCCEHQPLPLMTDAPPLRIFVDPEASPVAVTSPGPVPLHWEEQVRKGLDRDVKLGVIEKVPVNEPVKWCSRMLVTPKHDGTPRRVIDFSPLNKHAPRQTHHTRSPYQIAASVPGNKIKSVLDNWHGYHSVPLDPSDRSLTTFLTPYGRYRYKTTPQGLISAGDGYTHRMDLITEGFSNFDHCVDDTILWDDSIEENFFRVCEFITKCAAAGCIFSPKKFQFALEQVDFLGFTITKDGIKPQAQFIENIRSFPAPKCITDVRAWFGLVNQISYTFAQAPIMEPMRKLLSTKIPFFWSEQLDEIFEKSKIEVIAQCEKGVRSFKLNAPTALATDWSKLAVGCWLTQKQCTCEKIVPGCCPNGWQTIFATSRFNTPEVSRYHPIEGEAYAASWALERCRLFTLGHPQLYLAVDHKPLLAILGPNQDLSDLINPRLMNFKLKSMAYRFTTIHIPGKQHVVPDTLSRRSDNQSNEGTSSISLTPTDSAVQPLYSETFGPPSWVQQPEISTIGFTNVGDSQDNEALYLLAALSDSAEASATVALPNPDLLYNEQTSSVLAALSTGSEKDLQALTWDRLSSICAADEEYKKLHLVVSQGFPNGKDEYSKYIQEYFKLKDNLTTLGPVIMLQNRPVIPEHIRKEVLNHLHAAHAGVNSMFQRAMQTVYWPKYKDDIKQYQQSCQSCRYIAPSNPADINTSLPDFPPYPFHTVCADFFTYNGRNYLVLVDKYSNWINVMKPAKDDSASVIQLLRQYFATYGVCEVFCSDGATVFTSTKMKQFCRTWGVRQRISSAYYPQSNKRAEVGVKSAKRIIMDNLTPQGSLDSDKFTRAILSHRNAPDPDSNVSPAEIVFGHPIRDHLPQLDYKPRSEWTDLAQRRESAFMKRHYSSCEKLNRGARKLNKLTAGQDVYVQDQTGNTPSRWSKSGSVVEVLPYDSYLVKIHGSNKLTQRNRRFLRAFTPFKPAGIPEKVTPLPVPLPQQDSYINAVSIVMDTPLSIFGH